jgi:hypothetical protein
MSKNVFVCQKPIVVNFTKKLKILNQKGNMKEDAGKVNASSFSENVISFTAISILPT